VVDELEEVPEAVQPAEAPTGVEEASTLDLNETARRITFPYPEREYRCPACERSIPTRKQQRLAKPAAYDHLLNDVFKCPWCSFIFSPRRESATVLQR